MPATSPTPNPETETIQFQCAIAKGQIIRYLGGAPMDEEALSQLSSHVGSCASCTQLVDERRRAAQSAPISLRASRADRLEAASGGVAVISPRPSPMTSDSTFNNAPAAEPAPVAEAIATSKKFRIALPKLYRVIPDAATTTPARPPLTKSLLYGGALAATIGVMAFLGNPATLLGGKAADAPVDKVAAKKVAQPPVKMAASGRVAAGPLGIPMSGTLAGIEAEDGGADDVANVPPPAKAPPATKIMAPEALKTVVAKAKATPGGGITLDQKLAFLDGITLSYSGIKSFSPRLAISVAHPARKSHAKLRNAKRLTVPRASKAPAAPVGDTIRIYDATQP
ncbi:MAG: hypothetical protein C4320_04185 [Armatimonadota bacterium]